MIAAFWRDTCPTARPGLQPIITKPHLDAGLLPWIARLHHHEGLVLAWCELDPPFDGYVVSGYVEAELDVSATLAPLVVSTLRPHGSARMCQRLGGLRCHEYLLERGVRVAMVELGAPFVHTARRFETGRQFWEGHGRPSCYPSSTGSYDVMVVASQNERAGSRAVAILD